MKGVYMDLAILHGIQNTIGCDFLDMVMPAITMLGEKGAIWLIAGIVLICMKRYRRWGITLICGVALVWVVGDHIIKPLVARPRPFVVDPSLLPLLVEAPTDFSFPSGHTSASFAAATVLLFSNVKKPWKVLGLVVAILIAFSRLYVCVHNPTDVLAGLVLGVAAGIIVSLVSNALAQRYGWGEPAAVPQGKHSR
ncbi:hypothetical protein AAY81_09005 [Denitrobacterium detoxificans]|nr:hypothetical protein AAY81_09005 [Denitrobacterium detoxificans]